MYKNIRAKFLKLILIIFAAIWLVFTIYPLVFAIQNSLKSAGEFLMSSPLSLPEKFRISNYFTVALEGGFYRYFINSVTLTVVCVFMILLSSSLLGFAFAKKDLKYKNIIFLIFLSGLYIPLHITLIPTYNITLKMGLYDSLFGLMGPLITICLPVSILVMTRFMNEIPDEVIEAAKIDGCSWMRIYWLIGIPLSKSALSTVAIWSAILVWNEFIYPLILVTSTANRPLPLAVWRFQGEYNMNTPLVLAFIVLSILPLLIVYMFFSEKIIKGLSIHGEFNK